MARPRQIDRAAVLAASLAIADEEGLAAVTMAAVARRLAVTPMALYRHVHDKADLLDGLVERLLDELPRPAPDVPWDERLAALGRGLRRTARRHPAVVPLLLQRPAATSAARGTRDEVVAALRAAGVPAPATARLERIIATMVLGFVVSEATGRFAAHSRRTVDADWAVLQEVVADLVIRHVPTAGETGGTRRGATR
jgi:AcrR family transcriptional regulator